MEKERAGMILILITVILWSTIEVASKVLHDQIPGMTIAFLRFLLGGIFLMPRSIQGLYGKVRRSVLFQEKIEVSI
jgi:drug/metabolite transporter (DMT)-like permease